MATPAQATNGNNKYYKDASNNVFESGSNRAIALPEFKQLGLNIDHINTQAPSAAAGVGVNTSIPNPATVSAGLQKVPTQSVGPDGKPIYDVFAGQEHIANPSDPRLQGVNITTLPEGTAPTGFQSKFQQGFNQANAANGGQPPVDSAAGADLVNTYSPTKTNDFASSFLQNDSQLTSMVTALQDYMSPQNQRASLTDTYNQMLKDSGVQAIDTELINMKNVIDGSEDDLRTEITKAGGFATDSQVLALTGARNKQLIKNYNTLLDTRNAKEKYLETAIGLEKSDREAADSRFEKSFNMAMQIADYQQKMQKNAVESLDRTRAAIGWDGILQATQGDEHLMGLVEKTYGLPQGGLVLAAQQAYTQRAQAEEKRQLDLQEAKVGIQDKAMGVQLKGEQLKTEKAQQAKIYSDINTKKTIPDTEKKAVEDKAIKAGVVLGKVAEAKKLVGTTSTGILGSATRLLGGSNARNLKATIDTIQANISFDTLQAMRDSSKTGGALGSISERELELLGSTVASLDIGQSPAQLKQSLDQVQVHYTNWLASNGYSVTPDGQVVEIIP